MSACEASKLVDFSSPLHLQPSSTDVLALRRDRKIAFLEQGDQMDIAFRKKCLGRSFLSVYDYQRALNDTAWMLL